MFVLNYCVRVWVCVIGNSAKNTKNHVNKFVSRSILNILKSRDFQCGKQIVRLFVVLFPVCTLTPPTFPAKMTIQFSADVHFNFNFCSCFCKVWIYAIHTKRQTSQFSNNFVDILAYILENEEDAQLSRWEATRKNHFAVVVVNKFLQSVFAHVRSSLLLNK